MSEQSIEVNRIGLYIAIPIYFAVLGGAAFWANRRNRRLRKKNEESGIPDGGDALTGHYLGGRDFGPLLTMGTMFAGWFSGYTIVGVPNEAYRVGWLSLRWLVATTGVVVSLVAVSPRLQKASQVRNHQSSADFLTDRFRSQLVRYACVFLQLLPSIIYLAGQCTAIRSTFNSIFGLDPNSVVAVILISGIILIFEFVGGLTSVAITDTIQASLMILCFILLSAVIKARYGGWTDLDWEEYPNPSHYQTPTPDSAFLFWSFVFTTSCQQFTLPQFLQRTYAARSPRAIKIGLGLLTMGPYVLMLPAIFAGTMGVQILADEGIDNPSSPIAAILEVLMKAGGFPYAVAVVMYTASLAAIMSTADSILIAVSHLVTAEVIYPLVPDAKPSRIRFFGRLVSLLTMAVALCVSILSGGGISNLASIQFALSFQISPAFFIGLFATKNYDCHPFSIFAGAVSGVITTFCLKFVYLGENYDPEVNFPFDAGLGGFLANVGILLICECFFRLIAHRRRSESSASIDKQDGVEPEKSEPFSEEFESEDPVLFEGEEVKGSYCMQPGWDIAPTQRFGKVPLTPTLMWEMMEGIREPFTVSLAWTLLFLLLSVSMSPIGVGGVPPLDEDGNLAYAPGVLRGIPAWAMSILIYSVIATAIVAALVWLYPDEFPSDETKLKPSPPPSRSANPNTFSLTAAELNTRSNYDALNKTSDLRKSELIRRSALNPKLEAVVAGDAATCKD